VINDEVVDVIECLEGDRVCDFFLFLILKFETFNGVNLITESVVWLVILFLIDESLSCVGCWFENMLRSNEDKANDECKNFSPDLIKYFAN